MQRFVLECERLREFYDYRRSNYGHRFAFCQRKGTGGEADAASPAPEGPGDHHDGSVYPAQTVSGPTLSERRGANPAERFWKIAKQVGDGQQANSQSGHGKLPATFPNPSAPEETMRGPRGNIRGPRGLK